MNISPLIQFSHILTQEEYKLFVNAATVMKMKRNEFLAEEGKICGYIGYCISGSFKYYVSDMGMKKITAFIFGKGFVTSYSSFLLNEPSKIYVQALEDSDVMIWSNETIQT